MYSIPIPYITSKPCTVIIILEVKTSTPTYYFSTHGVSDGFFLDPPDEYDFSFVLP
jgi:hypothetical protein